MHVKGKVVGKTETPVPQLLNGKMWFLDFPMRREKIHHVHLDTGQHKIVTPEQYSKIEIGDTETVFVSDPPNWRYVILLIVIFVLVVLWIVYG